MLQCTGRLHTVLAYMLFVSVYCTVYNILYFPIAVDVGGIPDLLMVEFFVYFSQKKWDTCGNFGQTYVM